MTRQRRGPKIRVQAVPEGLRAQPTLPEGQMGRPFIETLRRPQYCWTKPDCCNGKGMQKTFWLAPTWLLLGAGYCACNGRFGHQSRLLFGTDLRGDARNLAGRRTCWNTVRCDAGTIQYRDGQAKAGSRLACALYCGVVLAILGMARDELCEGVIQSNTAYPLRRFADAARRTRLPLACDRFHVDTSNAQRGH